MKLNNTVIIYNEPYSLIFPLLGNAPSFGELSKIIFEIKSNTSEETIPVSLYEIISIFDDKTDTPSGLKLSELIQKRNDLTRFYHWNYWYDPQNKTLWETINRKKLWDTFKKQFFWDELNKGTLWDELNNKWIILNEINQATPKKNATETKKLINITTTSGFQGILTIEGDKRSITLDTPIQNKHNNLYLSDLKYYQKVLIKKTDPYMEVNMTQHNLIDLSSCSQNDIDQINERMSRYTMEEFIQRQGNDLIIYNPDWKHADNFLSAFNREDPIEDTLEKIKFNYSSEGQKKIGDLFWLSVGYEALYGKEKPKVILKDFIPKIRTFTLAEYPITLADPRTRKIIYNYHKKEIYSLTYDAQGYITYTLLCKEVIKAKREDITITFKTRNSLLWAFSIKQYNNEGKHEAHLTRISKEYLQDKTRDTDIQILQALFEAKKSLLKNNLWSKVEIPDDIQYDKKINLFCSHYDLSEKFQTDPRIIKLDDKIIFTNSSEKAKSAVYNYQERKFIDLDMKKPYSNICALNKKLILFGSWNDNNSFSTIEIYDSNTGKWEIINHQTEPRSWTSIAIIGNKAIFFGGRKNDRSRSCSTIDIYDDDTQEWKTIDHPIEARFEASVAVMGNKAIFFGGWSSHDTPSSKIDIYDSDTDSWQTVDDYETEARATASVAVVGNKAIFFGGRKSRNHPISAIDIYNNDTGKWQTAAHPIEARIWGSAAIVRNKAIFFGGKRDADDYYNYSSAIDIYDNETDKWTSVSPKIEARAIAATAVIENKAIFFGGWSGRRHSSDIDIYDTENGTWAKSKITNTALKIMEDGFVVIVKGSKATFIAIDENRNAIVYEIQILPST